MPDVVNGVEHITLLDGFPVNTNHVYDIYTMADQRRRRWADVL